MKALPNLTLPDSLGACASCVEGPPSLPIPVGPNCTLTAGCENGHQPCAGSARQRPERLDLSEGKLGSGSRVPGPLGPLDLCVVREGLLLRSGVLSWNLSMTQS